MFLISSKKCRKVRDTKRRSELLKSDVEGLRSRIDSEFQVFLTQVSDNQRLRKRFRDTKT